MHTKNLWTNTHKNENPRCSATKNYMMEHGVLTITRKSMPLCFVILPVVQKPGNSNLCILRAHFCKRHTKYVYVVQSVADHLSRSNACIFGDISLCRQAFCKNGMSHIRTIEYIHKHTQTHHRRTRTHTYIHTHKGDESLMRPSNRLRLTKLPKPRRKSRTSSRHSISVIWKADDLELDRECSIRLSSRWSRR